MMNFKIEYSQKQDRFFFNRKLDSPENTNGYVTVFKECSGDYGRAFEIFVRRKQSSVFKSQPYGLTNKQVLQEAEEFQNFINILDKYGLNLTHIKP
jgi:hypothetical protein